MSFRYGLVAKIRNNISRKLKNVEAISPESAVIPIDAKLTIRETDWLRCLAGGRLGRFIKKTKDGRYYI